MRKQYKYLIIIVVLIQLLFVGCKQQKKQLLVGGPGTELGLNFNSEKEFKENFAEFMAYPTYFPFEFNKENKIMLNAFAPYNDKGFKEREDFKAFPEKRYKRIDIFNNIRLGYSKIFYEKDLNDELIYRLEYVSFGFLPYVKTKEDLYAEQQDFSEIEHKGYTVYCNEEMYYNDGSVTSYNNIIYLYYYMKFDNKFYVFSIWYYVNYGTSKDELLRIRDKVKEEALVEVVKSYESLKYENRN